MKAVVTITLVGLFLHFISSHVCAQTTWRTYLSPDKTFSVEAPAPLREVASFDGEHGATLDADQRYDYATCYAVFETNPEAARFGVAVVNGRLKHIRSSPRSQLLWYLSAVLIGDEDNPNAKIEKRVSVNGLSGNEYFHIRENPNGNTGEIHTRGRIFDTGSRIYVITYIGQNNEDLTSPEAERFLNSFRLKKPGSLAQNNPFDSRLAQAKAGNVNAYNSILSSAQKGDKRALAALISLAIDGGGGAQNELGIMYSEAQGVKPNQRKAVYWFRKSAESGYAIGTCNLALHYGHGWGVRRNLTLMMKYVFAAHALDGLKCHPADYIEYFKLKPNQCEIERGWDLAENWLRAHPDFKNGFGERPWTKENGDYPETFRERGPSVKLPPTRKGNCNPKR